jgi:ubiquinone/menaquinone biosynthesis C-methylase UbiE
MNVQVDKSHYDFKSYVDLPRFNSFYYQLNYINQIKPNKVLDIGPGNNFLKYLLNRDFEFKTIDIDQQLSPDFIGSVDNLPLSNNSFDLICCFQVLEHLPIEKLEICLNELHRVSSHYVLLSLPYSRLEFKFNLKILFFKELKIKILIPKFYKRNKFDGQHYWEIGRKKSSKRKIKNLIEKHFIIEEILNPHENTYHIFYRLKKR